MIFRAKIQAELFLLNQIPAAEPDHAAEGEQVAAAALAAAAVEEAPLEGVDEGAAVGAVLAGVAAHAAWGQDYILVPGLPDGKI